MSSTCLLAMAVSACLVGCTSQTFAQKTPDGAVYVNSSTSFLFFSSGSIKKCTESGTTLTCQKMAIVDVGGDDSSDDDSKSRVRKRAHDDDDDSDEDSPKKKSDNDDSDDDSDDGSKEKSRSSSDDD